MFIWQRCLWWYNAPTSTLNLNLHSPTAHNLNVNVTSSDTMYYVATSLTLTCQVGLEAVEPVSYQWSSSCSGQCSVDGQTSDVVAISLLRSIDSGIHTCIVTDSVGNTGNGSLQFNVTGKLVDEEERIAVTLVFVALLYVYSVLQVCLCLYLYKGVALYHLGEITHGRPAANNSIIQSGNIELSCAFLVQRKQMWGDGFHHMAKMLFTTQLTHSMSLWEGMTTPAA